MRILFAVIALALTLTTAAQSQPSDIEALLEEHREIIVKSSRKSIGSAIDALASSGLPQAREVLERWQAKDMWYDKAGARFVYFEELEGKTYALASVADGSDLGQAEKGDLKQLKPNSGIRGLIGAALVQFQLSDPDPAVRIEALDAIARDAEPSHLPALEKSLTGETDVAIRTRKDRLLRILTIAYSEDSDARIKAIRSFDGDLGVDARGALNPILATTRGAAAALPEGANIARTLAPGSADLGAEDAYTLLVEAELAPERISRAALRAALETHSDGDTVGGVPSARLTSWEAREEAYHALAAQGLVPPTVISTEAAQALQAHVFFDRYLEPDAQVTLAAEETLAAINTRVGVNQTIDLALDALSLASIYFLAAIGLAITFGVMGVINMAHGEFIMMGAYTGYVVQLVIPDYTLSIIVALPLAFAVTFGAGVAMERLVIRWLYHRPLETLLATFGISIALQQLAKNIFGTQARPLTSPGWLDGAWAINDVVSISYIRIAIFVLALLFLALFIYITRRTRLGLDMRAVTQNPRMAASMGINPDRINMLTFGLGSGIAGVAGVAIGLFAKVTSELGQDYIVQSFMTVVVGGVGNIWGTLAGAAMIGFLQKGIEWMNPSNTLAAQTYMILFIILFIQFRPRGIIALKGRAAGD